VGSLLFQARQTTQEYDRLLAGQVSDGLAARQIQVEFKRQVQEWKNILLRGSEPRDLAGYTDNFHKQDAIVRKLTDAHIARTADPRVRADLTRFRTAHQQLDAAYERAHAGFVASRGLDFATADQMVRGQDRPPTTLLDGVVEHLNASIAAQVAHQKATVVTRQRIGLITGLVLLGVLAVLVSFVVRRIVRPIRGLTAAARQVADETLPAVITRIKALPPDEDPPALPPYQVPTHDELNDLAEAFAQIQASAVRLATEQHRDEQEAAKMLIDLGRRNQNLLSRLLSQVTSLERTEQSPEMLGKLFRLDHAATRIRRNAESMLVLAGATQIRTYSVPVPFEDIIRAALSEIEDYVRVDLYHVEGGLANGSAAADVVHLLAELIENATHFSPPHTQVTVVGQQVRGGYRIRIIDQGVGMTHRELNDANERILLATRGRANAKLLGLYVVGRLATRRGIEVTLEPSTARGITATVLIPAQAMADGVDGAPQVVPDRSVQTQAPDAAGPHRREDLRPARTARVQNTSAHTASGASPQLPRPTSVRRIPPVPAAAGSGRAGAGAGRTGTGKAGTGRTGTGKAGAGSDTGRPGMPKRVRGAQLASLDLGELDLGELDLGESDPGPDFDPTPERSRLNLRSFQLDVDAARRVIDGQDTTNHDQNRESE
jgi:HAMP domain-containing protein/anti-sigma regulatory factor (Ser/Thr protein kinase)